jgi:Bifunctional DNA primase/polymerase, N-terminal/Primase C terminal 1 (PriCT-1)
MGVFREWQPRYLEHGIATFPVEFERLPDGKVNKKPMVSGYMTLGTRNSSKLATRPRFYDCDGIGFCPNRSYGPRITVLDIDIADPKEVDKAIERHGDTPIIVKTASNKYHLYYRHNRERRLVGGGGDKIDVLGAGFVVSPPSISLDGGRYEFIRGDLRDIRNLPTMRGVSELVTERKVVAKQGPFKEGNRNDMLFRACMYEAKQAESFDDLLAWARDFNGVNMQPALLDMEVIRTATSAWEYQVRGENFIGGGGRLVTMPDPMLDDLMHSNQDAILLMLIVRRNHWSRERFHLANGMAETMEWTLPRFKRARRLLVERGYIRLLRPATNKAPAEYGWPQVGQPRKTA